MIKINSNLAHTIHSTQTRAIESREAMELIPRLSTPVRFAYSTSIGHKIGQDMSPENHT